jgi:xylan 1,4-beta-xylosidase
MLPVDAILADGVRGAPDLGAVASLDEARGRLTILLWSYHDVAGGYDDRRAVEVRLLGLPDVRADTRWIERAIDETSGNAYTAWLAMGSPQPPAASQIARLHAAAEMKPARRHLVVGRDRAARLTVTLPRHSVKLIELDLPPAP